MTDNMTVIIHDRYHNLSSKTVVCPSNVLINLALINLLSRQTLPKHLDLYGFRCFWYCLTHLSLASFYGSFANNAEPDQTPLNVASDQVLHRLLTEYT